MHAVRLETPILFRRNVLPETETYCAILSHSRFSEIKFWTKEISLNLKNYYYKVIKLQEWYLGRMVSRVFLGKNLVVHILRRGRK